MISSRLDQRRRKSLALSMILLWLLAAAGCGGWPPWPEQLLEERALPGEIELQLPPVSSEPPLDTEIRRGLLYYPDRQRRFLVPVYRPIPYAEAIARVTLEQLLPSARTAAELEEQGLAFALPAYAEVRGMTIKDGLARVDFSAAIFGYPAEDERLVLGSLLGTLQQFPTIEQLQILVEGFPVEKFPGGASGLAPLGPQCLINLETFDVAEDHQNVMAVKLFFCYRAPGGKNFYVPVTRVLPLEEEPALTVLRELLEGPRLNSGLFSDIPPGTEVLEVISQEGLVTINLSRRLLTYEGGRTGAENMVMQLLLTAGSLNGVAEVQILVENEALALPLEIKHTGPVKPPSIFNYF